MDESAIRQITKTFVAAYNRRDPGAVAQLYADDAKLMPPNWPVISGTEAIQSFWKMGMDRGLSVDLETEDLVDGSTAYERGVINIAAPPSPQQQTSKGKYVTVMRRQTDGSWRLVLDIWNIDSR